MGSGAAKEARHEEGMARLAGVDAVRGEERQRHKGVLGQRPWLLFRARSRERDGESESGLRERKQGSSPRPQLLYLDAQVEATSLPRHEDDDRGGVRDGEEWERESGRHHPAATVQGAAQGGRSGVHVRGGGRAHR